MNKLISSIFYTLFTETNGNFVFSPASYLEGINRLGLCLREDNLRELLHGLEVTEEEFATYLKAFKENIHGSLENYNCFLSAYGSPELNPEVIQQLKELDTEFKSFDGDNLDSLVVEINSLVTEKTHGKINNLVSWDQLSNLLIFAILNCVYFKKEWLNKFTVRHSKESFFGINTTQVNFLHDSSKNYRFYEDLDLDIVELPYKDSDVCCYLLVPKRDLFSIIDSISNHYDKIKLVKAEDNTIVDITTPSFKVESTFSLEKATAIAGLGKVFTWNKDWNLDWSKVLPGTVLKVDTIIQKAFLEFTKDGTEAAAATITMCLLSGCMMSPPKDLPRIKYIRADKPFIYVLANKQYFDTPLFMGVINQVI